MSSSPIDAVIRAFSQMYGEKAQEMIVLLLEYLQDDSLTIEQAVEKTIQTVGAETFVTEAVIRAAETSVAIGYGTSVELLPRVYAWNSAKMKLSERLHGTAAEMRQAIVKTIQEQQRLNKHSMQIARALYDGYNSGHVVQKQQIAKYMQELVDYTRHSQLAKRDQYDIMRKIRRARKQIDAMGKRGAPNKALKTAYNQLLIAIEDGNTKAMEKAVKTAIEEKSRYVAERIARTESARAWADGFHTRYDDDDSVTAYQWKLSSRHPAMDICDMYAHANLWGMGSGIFPKEHTPTLPIHPHCLCHLGIVRAKDLQATDRIKQGGDEWLKAQSAVKREKLLGIAGNKAWERGKDWQKYMRNWTNDAAQRGLIETNKDDKMKKTDVYFNLQLFAEVDITKQTVQSLRKGIRSLEKNIKKHEGYIKNPLPHCPEWEDYPTNRKKGLIRHWEKEIYNSEESIKNRKEELKKRGVTYE